MQRTDLHESCLLLIQLAKDSRNPYLRFLMSVQHCAMFVRHGNLHASLRNVLILMSIHMNALDIEGVNHFQTVCTAT